MKRISYIILAILPLILTSCLGDLNTKPLDETIFTDDKAYQNELGYTQGLAKLYAGSRTFWTKRRRKF